jgi:XisH protein
MPAKDLFHDCVRHALIHDGWTITHDPLRLTWGGKDLYVDLGAERLMAAEKSGQRIAVEIKSFVGDSEVDDLEKAVGQYVLYRAVLAQREPERELFLAVPELIIRDVFDQSLGELLLKDQSIRVLGFDPQTEVITRWIA